MSLLSKMMVIVGGLVLWSSLACATVVGNLYERNWLGNDSALTYDESTGLEWLDVNLTSKMTLDQIDSSGILNVFRWAEPLEIENLLDAAIAGVGERRSRMLDDNNNTMTVISYLGMTGGEEDIRWTQGYTMLNDNEQGGASVFQMYGALARDCTLPFDFFVGCDYPYVQVVESDVVYDATNFDEVMENNSWGFTGPAGAMLVRDALHVSEPPMFFMFFLGLMILGFCNGRVGD